MWGKYNSVSLWFFFFLVIVRVYSWHLQKCEATPDVERWRAELSWRGSSDESLPQRCSWNRWAFWVCQHRTLSSAKPLTDHLCVEALSLLPSNSRIWVTDSTGTCSSLHPSKHLHRYSMLGQRTCWCPHLGPHMHVGQAGKDIAHSLDNKPDLLNLGSHSSAHVTLLPSRPSPPHPPTPHHLAGRLFHHFLLGELASSLPFGDEHFSNKMLKRVSHFCCGIKSPMGYLPSGSQMCYSC